MAYRDTVLGRSGLLHYWDLQEAQGASTAVDAAGNDDITITGATAGVNGLPSGGTSLSFDGSNDEANSGDIADLDSLSAMTLVAWFYPTEATFGGNDHIAGTRDDDTDDNLYFLGLTGTTNIEYRYRNSAGTVFGRNVTGWVQNTWNQAVITVETNSVRTFINGAESGSALTGTTGSFSTNAKTMALGNERASSAFFNGRIAHVQFYNRVLTPTEISDDYTEGTTFVGQSIYAASDVTDGSWTTDTGGTSLFAAIDETSPSDSDYIQSALAPSNDMAEIALGSVNTPASGNRTLKIRRRKSVSPAHRMDLTFALYKNTTQVQSFTMNDINGTWVTESFDLTSDPSAWNDLRVRITANKQTNPTTAPTFVAAGTASFTATNATNLTPGLPSGWAADDIHIMLVARSDNTDITDPSGWTRITPSSAAENNTTLQRVEVFWRRAVGGDTAPSVTAGSSTVVRGARIFGVRGCPTSGDPFAFSNGGTRSNNAASATVTTASMTPTENNTFNLFLSAYEDDPNAYSQPSGWSTVTVAGSTLGNDMDLTHATLTQTTAAALNPSSTVSGGSFANSANVGILLSLKGNPPADARANVSWLVLEVPEPASIARSLAATAAISTINTRVLNRTVAIQTTETRVLTRTVAIQTVETRSVISTIAIESAVTSSRSVGSTVSVQDTYLRSINASAAILQTNTRPLTSTVAVSTLLVRPLTSSVAIRSVETRIVNSTVSVQSVEKRILSQTVAISATETRSLGSSAAITQTNERIITSTAAISVPVGRTVNASVAITQTNTNSVASTFAISGGSTRTLTPTVSITETLSRTFSTTVSVQESFTRSVAMSASIMIPIARSLSDTVAVSTTETRNLVTTVAVQDTSIRNVAATAALQVSLTRSLSSMLSMFTTTTQSLVSTVATSETEERIVSATLSLTAAPTRAVSSSIAIRSTETRTVTTTIAIFQVNQRTVANTAAISLSFERSVVSTISITEVFNRSVGTTISLTGNLVRTVATAIALQLPNTRTLSMSASVQEVSSRILPTSASISTFSTRTVATSLAMSVTLTRVTTSTLAITQTNTRTLSTSIAISQSHNRSLSTSAAIQFTYSNILGASVSVTQLNIRSLSVTTLVTVSGTRILGATLSTSLMAQDISSDYPITQTFARRLFDSITTPQLAPQVTIPKSFAQ